MKFRVYLLAGLIIPSSLWAKITEVKYSYDKLGRLSSVVYASNERANEFYTYDEQGNLAEKKIGEISCTYKYDKANQLTSFNGPEGERTYKYDKAGRLLEEYLNGELDVSYKYGYLDKVIEINRKGKVTKFKYDAMGMLIEKILPDGQSEKWVWDGIALVARGNDIYVNEPHASGGIPILTKTDKGVRYHTSDILGTTLWSTDMKGNRIDSYADTSVFGEGSIQHDRAARFTGKPYDEDLQAFVFPYRNYKSSLVRWTSSDPSGFPDGINNHYYAAIPTIGIDPLGLSWGVTDFLWHYYFGNGSTVTLSELGLDSAIKSHAETTLGVKGRFGDQIESEAIETAPTEGSFSKAFVNAYSFGAVSYCIGGATLSGEFNGTLNKGKEHDDGKSDYYYSGSATINFSDDFTDPLSIIEYFYGSSDSPNAPSWLKTAANMGGTPFHISGGWTWSYSGAFEK